MRVRHSTTELQRSTEHICNVAMNKWDVDQPYCPRRSDVTVVTSLLLQEMLKAVKSKEAAAAAAAGCQATDQDVSPLRTASSDKASRGPTSRKLRSSQSFNLNRDEPRAEMGTSRARRSLTKTNSPKVSGASASSACPTHDKVTSKERRINLGTKAADLFAKLQQRLSANKS